MSYADWYRQHHAEDVPARERVCLFRGPFPCNAGCMFAHPRRCVNAERVRQEEAAR